METKNTAIIELGNQLEAKRKAWMDDYAKFQKVGDAQALAMTGEDVNRFKAYEAEVTELQAKYDGLVSVEMAAEANRKALEDSRIPANRLNLGGKAMQAEQKGIFEEFKAKAHGFRNGVEVDLDQDAVKWLSGKATMTTGANGYPPEVLRDGDVVAAISRPPQLLDFLRMEPTTQNGISFMAQTVRTNTAAAKSEGAAADEATITYANTTDIISRIPVWIPVTEEQLEDEPGVQSLVQNDLVLMVRQVLDENVTVGNGTAPNLRGVFNATNVQTQAKGTDPALDAILKAITKIRVTGRANAGVVVMHGTDHQNLALTRTADGVYILGNPTDSAVVRVWGLPIALSEALTVTNALVLDPFYFRVKMRSGVNIAISDSHGTNFINGILAIRATVRAGLKKMRGQAACTITGL